MPNPNERYTYSDYLSWDDSERWELIGGVPFAMPPAPSRQHQFASGSIYVQLSNYLRGKTCEAYIAPFDVRLNPEGDDDTVVQPDVIVVCDKSKLNDRGCKGAPDLVVETLSDSTARRDRWVKYNLYKNAGVREYWIVDTDSKTVAINALVNGEYLGKSYGDTDMAPVGVLPGCSINLQDVFME
jgi:Uma2 family endonuclease